MARAALFAAASIGVSRVRPFVAPPPAPPGMPIFSRIPPQPEAGSRGAVLGLRARRELLVGRFAVDRLLIVPRDQRSVDHLAALLRRERPQARARRHHERALDRIGPALLVEEGDQRLAHGELGDRLLHLHLRVWTERGRRGLHRLLVARREGAQRVLHAIAELAQHRVGHVERILRDEVHAHALRAHEAHDLLDALEQLLRRVVEQQVRLVEEEHQLGLLRIADLGQGLEELREQPQQQRRVHARARRAACRRRGC